MVGRIGRSLNLSQLRQLKSFAGRINRFGANFAVCNGDGELILVCEGGRFQSARDRLLEAAQQVLNQKDNLTGQMVNRQADKSNPSSVNVQICGFGQENRILSTVLKWGSEAVAAALVDLGDDALCPARDTQYYISDAIFSEMLGLLAENFEAGFKAERQMEMISSELAQTYEELVLLHKLSMNMKVTEQDADFLQMACDSLTEIVLVEGIAILLEKTIDDEKKLVLAAGSGLIDIDERMATILHSRLADAINSGKEALLDSEVDSPLKYDWPSSIKNIIAVPLYGKERADSHFSQTTENGNCMIGLMVAVNRIDKQDFDSTDVKLFNSVASGGAVFIENGRLFKDLEELFIGSLKALTGSIDAKDKYTRGHSERVALISRWIAERLAEKEPLEQERIHKMYLAGLLHDIGKIGIEEAVLCKEGPLTEYERDRIRQHPSIGANILGPIKQMRDILPGVLYHHERPDGKGYPRGLTGQQTPLIGRIVGLADSFDAMTSKRTYREAKTVEQALVEIQSNLGTQFDEKVGMVFIGSDVYQLWDILQNSCSNIYEHRNSSEYGVAAVGTLIR